ncbi:hypothetical protein I4U23_022271 [Adineta vaga]|nr:hypothetical protein I4U23_022271 [Adineta vaga]
MPVKDLLRWCGEQLQNYNVFIPDEEEYNDNSDHQSNTNVKNQKYATRLYVILLIITFYTLFFVAFVNPKSELTSVSNISSADLDQLRLKYGKTLSCPCTTSTIPYNAFVSHIISFHPVCSSFFVSRKWIKSLYLSNASEYLVMDFRTTASKQFELLASLCSLCKETIFQANVNLDNSELVSVELLPEDEVQTKVDGSVSLIRNSIPIQINLLLDFLQISTRSNSLVSALNTNAYVSVWTLGTKYADLSPTWYVDKNAPRDSGDFSPCHIVNSTVPSGFYWIVNGASVSLRYYWPEKPFFFEPDLLALVPGFFAGCTPLDGILQSTFDCLYDLTCLQLLADYFPNLNRKNFTSTNLLSSSNRPNISLNDRLSNLLVERWTTKVDYSKYFTECAVKSCTYIKVNQANYSYIITLFLSLYGGLTIILRFIAAFSVNLSFKAKHHQSSINVGNGFTMKDIRRLGIWMKQLNIFESASRRTSNDIKQQRISTRIYLILLSGLIMILLLFTSLRVEMIMMTVTNPSLAKYNNLQDLYSSTLRCPCSNITTPYSTLITLSVTLHEICSSDFVVESWIEMTKLIEENFWYGFDARHFRLLSNLCQLINKTIDDAILRFNERYFITSTVINQDNFDARLNTTINQFTQTLVSNFNLLINAAQLFIHVDQPLAIPNSESVSPLTYAKNVSYFDQSIIPLSFRSIGVLGVNASPINCLCAVNSTCQSPVARRPSMRVNGLEGSDGIVPGMTVGCFVIDSLQLSTLECFYSEFCLSLLYLYMNETASSEYTGIRWFNAHHLVYNPESTRFALNTSLGVILREMLVEKWNVSFSFDQYYRRCAPNYCTYSITARTKSFVEIVIILMSTISGLVAALTFIIPKLVALVSSMIQPRIRQQQQESTSLLTDVRPPLAKRMKMAVQKLITLLYTTLFNLNMFPPHRFMGSVTRTQSKRFGQLATRLHLVLLILGFSILIFYTIIEPRILKETISKPSLRVYNDLVLQHSDTLQCPCSKISSIYNRYVSIEPVFHQVNEAYYPSLSELKDMEC